MLLEPSKRGCARVCARTCLCALEPYGGDNTNNNNNRRKFAVSSYTAAVPSRRYLGNIEIRDGVFMVDRTSFTIRVETSAEADRTFAV